MGNIPQRQVSIMYKLSNRNKHTIINVTDSHPLAKVILILARSLQTILIKIYYLYIYINIYEKVSYHLRLLQPIVLMSDLCYSSPIIIIIMIQFYMHVIYIDNKFCYINTTTTW